MKAKLHIACMPFGFSKNDIRELLGPYARVNNIQLEQDLKEARFDAFAVAEVETESVENLLSRLDGKQLGARPLRVNEVVERKDLMERREGNL